MIYSTRRFVLCLALCYFVLVFFSPFNIAITSLGEERDSLVLSVSSSSLCLGRAAVCDCGTPWTFLLPFFVFHSDDGNFLWILNFVRAVLLWMMVIFFGF